MPTSLTASPVSAASLDADPVVLEDGLYPPFYPGPTTYPGPGNTLSGVGADPVTLTGTPA